MAESQKAKERASFRKMILEMLPAAQKIIKAALKPARNRRGADGKVTKRKAIPPKSLDLAKYVMDQYSKMVLPDDPDVHELHIVDHAMLAQLNKAKDILKEMNSHRANKRAANDRGLDVGNN